MCEALHIMIFIFCVIRLGNEKAQHNKIIGKNRGRRTMKSIIYDILKLRQQGDNK